MEFSQMNDAMEQYHTDDALPAPVVKTMKFNLPRYSKNRIMQEQNKARPPCPLLPKDTQNKIKSESVLEATFLQMWIEDSSYKE